MSVALSSGNTLSRTTNLPTNTLYTVAFWWQWNGTPSGFVSIFSLDDGTSPGYFGLYANNSTQIFKESSSPAIDVNVVNPGTAWVFICLVRNGTGTNSWIAYSGTTGTTLSSVSQNSVASAGQNAMYLGTDGFAEPANGRMDNFMLFNRALSPAEVDYLYRQRRPINTDNLDSWLPMVDVANFEKDIGGLARNWTKTGTPAVNTSAAPVDWLLDEPIYVPGAGGATNAPAAGTTSPTDAIAGASSATKTAAGTTSPVDAVSGASSVTKATATAPAPIDTVSGGGGSLAGGSSAITTADAVSGTSVATKTSSPAVAPADSIAGTSAVTKTASSAVTPADAVSGGGTATDDETTIVAPVDAVGGVASVTKAASSAVAPSDAVAGAGGALVATSGSASPGDTVGGTTTVTAAVVVAVAPSDAVAGAGGSLVAASTGVAPSDSVGAVSSVLRSTSTAVAPTDASNGVTAAGVSRGDVAPVDTVGGASAVGIQMVGAVAPLDSVGAVSSVLRSTSTAVAHTDAVTGASAVTKAASADVSPGVNVSGIVGGEDLFIDVTFYEEIPTAHLYAELPSLFTKVRGSVFTRTVGGTVPRDVTVTGRVPVGPVTT